MSYTTEKKKDETYCHAIIRAVAAVEDRERTNIYPPLYNSVDPEALDKLFHAEKGRVTFSYHGYEVAVKGSGEIHLREID
ncbi:hypothetical protein HYG81_21385 (plasmid) [Natrinema zhouii]|uniref:HalOD1 output domain-containing protein n=1 Tax=Natrinema zhouii TaxID=1710539 RepID=UPI001CFF7D1C|nr:HalOD1 output domain-containing protein [Natrinema zhouii]UHQ98134.1 hypothetical protein HYG81_21385 [Natrinema zhouii]